MVKRGDLIEVTIESAAFEGTTVARLDGLVVFVPFGVPGDRVQARIVRKRRKYLEAVIESVLEPSPLRREPRCVHFGTCGGCRLQNVEYDRQLEFKGEQVRSLLERIGGLSSPPLLPVLPSPREYAYRNKMEYSFGNSRWLTREEIASEEVLQRDFALGLHVPGRFDKILDLHECYLQDDFSIALVSRLRALALEQGWEPYDTIHNTGYLRNLVIRAGQNTDQVMVVVVTTSHQPDRTAMMVELIQKVIPSVTTVVNSINSGRSPVAAGEEIVCLGKGFIHERIRDRLFQVTPTAFFQPNTLQAEHLMGTILDYSAATESRGLLFDLFCGLGTIGLILADHFDRVFGIESHPESIRLAQINAKLNQVQNAHFVQGDAAQALQPDSLRQTGAPDVLVLDPPRAGLHQDVVSGVLECRPPRVVYTSCNPATLARDLNLLSETYEVEAVQPVDMFPQTYHIECVAALRLRNRP